MILDKYIKEILIFGKNNSFLIFNNKFALLPKKITYFLFILR